MATIEQLLGCTGQELEAMSDEQLALYLADVITDEPKPFPSWGRPLVADPIEDAKETLNELAMSLGTSLDQLLVDTTSQTYSPSPETAKKFWKVYKLVTGLPKPKTEKKSKDEIDAEKQDLFNSI